MLGGGSLGRAIARPRNRSQGRDLLGYGHTVELRAYRAYVAKMRQIDGWRSARGEGDLESMAVYRDMERRAEGRFLSQTSRSISVPVMAVRRGGPGETCRK